MLSNLPPRDAKVGLLGGSFNPAHGGHRHVSQLALRRLALDRVWWLVSPQNPLKEEFGMAPLEARCAKAISIAQHRRIDVTSLERELKTVYTIDTIRKLKLDASHVTFVWIMGADNLAEVARWKSWRSLFKHVPVAIFDRANYARKALGSEAARTFARARVSDRNSAGLLTKNLPAWMFVRSELHPASATSIRSHGLWDWR